MVDGFINRRITNVIDTRVWSDTMKMGMIVLPNAYTTGTVAVAQGSNQIIGTGTNWPVNDVINTTSTVVITDVPGYVEITPGAGYLSKVHVGIPLLLDQGNASITEIVTPIAVGPTSFKAYCQYAHDTTATLQMSRLAGQQFQANSYIYTVQAVLSDTLMQVDFPYGGIPQAGLSYTVMQQYVQLSPNVRSLERCYDAIAGSDVGTSRDLSWVLSVDPQGQSTGNPQELASMPANPAGFMQWRVWPAQNTEYALGVIYEDGWPTLVYDTDVLPPFMNREIIIAGAIADCLRTRVIKNDRDRDPLYDPQVSQYWEAEFARLLENATQSDQGRRLSYLVDYNQQLEGYCYNWERSHAIASSSGWGGGFCI